MSNPPLTWDNLRSHPQRPKHVDDLKPMWEQKSFDGMTLHDIHNSLPAGLVPWRILVMDVVARLTTGSAFPAKIYAGAGRQKESWSWDDDSRNDLVQDVLLYMLGEGRDDTLDSGNQFIYVIKHAMTVDKVRKLLIRYTKKVLRKRFGSQALGHISDLLIKELEQNFRVVAPRSKKPRDTCYSNDQFDGPPCIESDQNQSICINEFMLMRRNKVTWGVDPDGKGQSFPRLYNRDQLKAAVSRIIERLEAPVRMGFLEDCLDKALVFLENASERQKDRETGDDMADIPDFLGFGGFGVHSDDLMDLSQDEDLLDDDLGGSRTGQGAGIIVTEIVEEMKAALDDSDLQIMRGTVRQQTHQEMAKEIGMSTKTIQRRLNRIGEELAKIRDESRSNHPSETDPDNHFNQAFSQLFAEFEAGIT